MNNAISGIKGTHKKELARLIIDADKVELAQRAIVANGTLIAVDNDFGRQTATALSNSRMTPILAKMWELEHPKKHNRIIDNSKMPKWIKIALKEIGVREIKGKRHNKRVIEYMNATKWGSWVHDDETPWCAGFVGWCIVKAGYRDQVPDYSLGAKSWLNFGTSAHRPVFGAIAVKSRKGGGHVGFVVGESKNYLYILGGNQGDKVSVRRYQKHVWIDFRIPSGYKPTVKLAKWNGVSALAGTEA